MISNDGVDSVVVVVCPWVKALISNDGVDSVVVAVPVKVLRSVVWNSLVLAC